MNWPVWLFIVVMVGLIALLLFTTMKAISTVLIAVTLWLAIQFEVWGWIPWVFWILVIITPIALLLSFRFLAYCTACVALAIAVSVVVVDGLTTYVPNWFDDDISDLACEDVSEEIQETRAAISDTEDSEEKAELNDELAELRERWNECSEDSEEAADKSSSDEDSVSSDDSDDAGYSEDSSTDSDAPSEDELQALMGQIEEDLTVNPEDILPMRAQCETDEFIPNSLAEVRAGDPAYRQWSDAVSIPFASQDKDEMLDEVFIENCGNPTELDMNIQALNRMTLLGFNVGENNPWMGEFLAEVESDGLRESFLTKKDGENGIYVTAEFQQYAAMTNTILLAFQNLGVMSDLVSSENWHIEGPVAGELPRTVLNPNQEGLPALVFEYTVKDNCSLVRFGFNTQDKRFELFVTPVCEEVPPTTPPCECPPETQPPCEGCETPPCEDCQPPCQDCSTPTTTKPPCDNCTTTTTTTVPCTNCTTTTTVPCGNKNVRDPNTGECVPNIPSGSTLPPPATVPPTATTVQPAPTPPSTAAPDPTPPNVTVVDETPPPNTYTPPGAVVGTTQPPPTFAPPATTTAPAPPGGGPTPTRP